MSEWSMKRFWKEAQVAQEAGGFSVTLDGRPVKTPSKAALVLPSRSLAEAIAAEWQAQEDAVDPESMPATRSANSAIDKVTHQHAEVAEMLAAYGDSDLTCYRADRPADLAARQAETWDPLLDWADARFGARLQPRCGVMHVAQDADALGRLGRELARMDAFELTAFHDLVTISGSLVIALAVETGEITPEAGWDASRIDETWQEEQWGEDEEAARMAAHKRAAFLHAARFLALSRDKSA